MKDKLTALGFICCVMSVPILIGNRFHGWDYIRSFPLPQFEPLARVPGVQLVSLRRMTSAPNSS
jgi:hypothetical protein